MTITARPVAVVTGATGAQAGSIARRFAAGGYHVRGLSRGTGPVPAGVERVQADPADADALARAFEGADVVALTAPIDYREGVRERLAAAVATAAKAAGVRRLVLNLAAGVFDDYDRPVSRVLVAMRETLFASGVTTAALVPTIYMDNLLQPWAADAMVRDGVLPYPALPEAPIAWISHRSLAEFAFAAAGVALEGSRSFRIGGPQNLTGPEVTAVVSRHLGRPVAYVAAPLDAFAQGLNAAMGPGVGDQIADLYRYVAAHPDVLARSPEDHALLGVTPESLDAWAARQAWPRAAA